MAKCATIQRYHLGFFAEFLEKLRKTPDGDGSLLDSLILVYGGGISNSDRHTHGPLPTLLLGGGAGTIKGGRHIVYPEHTPLTFAGTRFAYPYGGLLWRKIARPEAG